MKKINSIVWSYDFFFYTWLKHFEKEGFQKGMIPFTAIIALSFLQTIIYVSIILIQFGNCSNVWQISFFPPKFDWLNRHGAFIVIIILNALYFSWNKRYEKIEIKYDLMSSKIKIVGHRISWALFYLIVVFVMAAFLWTYHSAGMLGLCT